MLRVNKLLVIIIIIIIIIVIIINTKYNFLKHIRNIPKKVEIQDMKTGEIIIYSSMYKAAKRFNQQSRLMSTYDGKVWRNRYAIKILTESECF